MSRPGAAPSLRRWGAALAGAFLLGGVLYTFPLARHLTDGLPYAAVPPEGRETVWRVQGDYLQFYYYLWLVRDRLLAGASPLRDPYQFAVGEPRLNLPNTFAPLALVYLPLSLVDPRLAYNALVLLSFPAAGLAAALLARRYGVGPWGALVAGAVFATSPYRVGTLLGGHPAGLAFFLVPLALWGLEGALARSWAGGAWCGAALLAIAIVEPHFFLFAAFGLPVYLGARLGLEGWRREDIRIGPAAWTGASLTAAAIAWGTLTLLGARGWPAGAGVRLRVGAVIALAVLAAWQGARASSRVTGAAGRAVGPLALAGAGAILGAGFLLLVRRLVLSEAVVSGGRSLGEVLLFSPVPGDLATRVNPAAGRAIYPGVLVLLLALVGLAALVRRPPEPSRRILLAFGPLTALGTILALGPRFPALPLFEVAFLLVPYWNFVRQPGKIQVAVALGLALLAGAGADAVGARVRRAAARAALGMLVALAIAAEYHPWRPAGVSLLPEPDGAVAAIRTTGSRALYVPLWPGDSSYSALYLHTTTLTRVPMLNGYSAYIDRAYVDGVYRALEPLNVGHVGEAEHAALRRLGVRQVILDRDGFPLKVSAFGPAFTLAALRGSPYLEPVAAPADGSPLRTFRVRTAPEPTPGVVPRSPLGVFWEAESLRRETGRVVEDPEASNGRVVAGEAGRDRPGFLTFGPYRLLPPGEYLARFRVRGRGAGLFLQVTTLGGTRVVGTRALTPTDDGTVRDVPVPFTLDRPAAVEFRAKWDGEGAVAVDSVLATFADEPDPAPAFEVEALGHGLVERADEAASGGVAGYAEPARTPRDRVWSGPLRSYPAGGYRLWVRVRLDRPVAGSFLWCGAQTASLGPILGGRDFLGSEVPEPGRYVELPVPFTLPRSTVLELPCVYRGRAGVWVDRLRIEGPVP